MEMEIIRGCFVTSSRQCVINGGNYEKYLMQNKSNRIYDLPQILCDS
jgi:hypothetical protein